MKKSIIKLVTLFSILVLGISACSKEVKKDNSAADEATRKAAEKSVKELDKE